MNKEITCIILSGGKSSRMGTNKALLQLKEGTIIEHLVNLLKLIFNEVILITNSRTEYQFLDIKIFEDIYKEMGPLAGIHSGLVNSKNEKNFVISCDVPLISKEIIDYIINFKTDKKITLCEVKGQIQQLVGIYSKSLLPLIENILNNDKKHSVYSLLNKTDYEKIKIENIKIYRDEHFFNMNKPEDYQKILSKF